MNYLLDYLKINSNDGGEELVNKARSFSLKRDDEVQVKGDTSGFIYVIDAIVNGEALLKIYNKSGFFKISHWQPCHSLQKF